VLGDGDSPARRGRIEQADIDNRQPVESDRRQLCNCVSWPDSIHKALLLGVAVRTSDGARFNSACLVAPDGSVTRHDKLVLVWLAERLPSLLELRWFRARVLSLFTVDPSLHAGLEYKVLSFTTDNGRRIRLGVSICYEMYFPWLPQYRQVFEADAIVHVTNESWAAGSPTLARYENWTCQYRAIETRRWQLLCTSMGNSAVIDPGGVIRDILPGRQGVLRTPAASSPSLTEQPR
jgi:apolipoprotein N-acyltransferase